MSYVAEAFQPAGHLAVEAAESERVAFIRRTYAHLMTALLIFMGLEGLLLNYEPLRNAILPLIMHQWWITLLVFFGVSWLARHWAESGASTTTQYLGLALYTVAEAVIVMPLLFIASLQDPNIIPTAAIITLFLFGALTASVFITGADFSFLRTGLMIGSFAVLGLIVCGMLFGLSLGLYFTVGVIVLLCGYILYDTSNVLHHYRTDQHVAASLALFASVVTLFYYVVRLLMILQED